MAEKDRRLSPLTSNAIAYSWRQLAQRAGIIQNNPSGNGFERLNIPVYYARPDQVQVDRPGLIVTPCCPSAWLALLGRAPRSLEALSTRDVIPGDAQLPFDSPIPVLFWGEGNEEGRKPFAEVSSNGSIVFHADIIATTFFMLSRWEEMVTSARDSLERFSATSSVAYQQGFLDRPIVDHYALILRAWLRLLLPEWQPLSPQFSVKLSHDIDNVRVSSTLYGIIKRLGGDLLKRHSLRQFWQTSLDLLWQIIAPERTSYFQGIYTLSELSNRYSLDSAFYFMAAFPPGLPDNDYNLRSPLISKCIQKLNQQGFEIGLHPGYYTFNNPERLAIEKTHLDQVLGKTRYGGRQHCLRFQIPRTWRHLEQVGLTYDSTMTYADHEGFRCGTCHLFQPFDIEQDCQLKLWELPLIVMDVTLKKYRNLTPEQGQARILELARRCKQVEGIFTLLWHNSSLAGEWHAWAEVYHQIVAILAKLETTSTTLL